MIQQNVHKETFLRTTRYGQNRTLGNYDGYSRFQTTEKMMITSEGNMTPRDNLVFSSIPVQNPDNTKISLTHTTGDSSWHYISLCIPSRRKKRRKAIKGTDYGLNDQQLYYLILSIEIISLNCRWKINCILHGTWQGVWILIIMQIMLQKVVLIYYYITGIDKI